MLIFISKLVRGNPSLRRLIRYDTDSGNFTDPRSSALADFIDARVEPDAMDEINRSLKIANIYFYCDSQNPKTHSEIELLLSIVKTMVKGDQSIAKKLYLFRKEKGRRPRRDELLTFINSCSKYFDRIFVLIDALVRKANIFRLTSGFLPFIKHKDISH